MSIPAELSWPMDFFSNANEKHSFFSNDAIDASHFKYVSSSQFKQIIENVRRDRMRKRENKILSSHIREEDSAESESEDDDSVFQKIPKFSREKLENAEEIDQELERLKEDALPERKKRTSKSDRFVERRNSKAEVSQIAIESMHFFSFEQTSRFDKSKLSISRNVEKSRSMEKVEMPPTTVKERRVPTACERSPVTRLECSARTVKSQSESASRPKSGSSSRMCKSTNDARYSYCEDGSEHYDSDVDDDEKRVHPVVAQKIFSQQKRISQLLDEIAFRLGRIPMPDGDRDLRRRQQRLAEFSIRCSRNYLYDLGRQIGDIRRHVSAITSNTRTKPTRRGVSLHVQAIEQKLMSAHQLLANALDAYCKHIPSSVLVGQPGKLKEILRGVVELNDICSEIQLTTDYYGCGDVETPPLGKNTRNRCSAMLAKLWGSSDNESQVVSHTPQSTPVRGQRSKKASAIDNFKRVPSRLSMYSADPRLSGTRRHKRAASMCIRDQRLFGVARKMSSEQHPSIPQQPNTSPVTSKSSKVISKREKAIRMHQTEDEIRTMMSTLPTDSDADSSVALSEYSKSSVMINKDRTADKNSSPNSLIDHSKIVNDPFNDKPLVNDVTSRANQVTDEELTTLVPVIADLMTLVKSQENDVAICPVPSDSMNALMDLLKNYRSSTNPEILSSREPNVDARALYAVASNEISGRLAKKSRRTRNNGKNMQLFCVPAEECCRATRNSVDAEIRARRGKTERTVDLSIGATTKDSRTRSLRMAESSVESLLKYRDEYRCSSRSNPMYTSKGQNKPWDVVAWIADKLVEELVVDVAKEFQMDLLIRRLFELEFKEY